MTSKAKNEKKALASFHFADNLIVKIVQSWSEVA